AVAICRQLAADKPSTYGPDLALALNNLGIRLSEAGRREEALSPTNEAVAVCRQLAVDNPAHLPALALALNNLGIRLSEAGRSEEALSPTNEAVAIRHRLAVDNPDAHVPALGKAQWGHAWARTGTSEHLADARAAARETVERYRKMQIARPTPLAGNLADLGMGPADLGSCDEPKEPRGQTDS
ncbi:tetratricopeptide repeat protein, partial [Nocardia tengchongensis]